MTFLSPYALRSLPFSISFPSSSVILSPFDAKSFHEASAEVPSFLTTFALSSEKSTVLPVLTSTVLVLGATIETSFTSELVLWSLADLLLASLVAAEIPLALTVAPVTLSNIFLPS